MNEGPSRLGNSEQLADRSKDQKREAGAIRLKGHEQPVEHTERGMMGQEKQD